MIATMMKVRTPFVCRYWESFGSGQQLQQLTIDHPDGQVRILPWWFYQDYAWATIWPNEQCEGDSPTLGTPMRVFVDIRGLEVVNEAA